MAKYFRKFLHYMECKFPEVSMRFLQTVKKRVREAMDADSHIEK